MSSANPMNVSEIEVDVANLYREETFTDLKVATLQQLTPVKPDGSRDESRETIFWQDEQARKLVRIDYATDGGSVLGFNLMGIRYRQDVCERWILEQRPIDYVIGHLREANFDPEFFRRYEDAVRVAYNGRHPERAVQPLPKRGFFSRWFT